jgi:drug/metabolite transporter (DMT)-like permease
VVTWGLMRTDPIVTGTLLALTAAGLFGLTTPVIQRAGDGLGPFATAALLYAGAAAMAALTSLRGSNEAPVGRQHLPRLALVALFGAFVAPVLLAIGLARTSGAAASLLLNLEAVFTAVLSVVLYREHFGRRVVLAVAVIAGGGALLVADRSWVGRAEVVGLLAVAAATAGWAADNALSRPLADLDGAQVVFGKGLLGALLSTGIAVAVGEGLPTPGAGAVLFLCGLLGYGASLRLYLLAQRRLGAARTGSVFAVAPFFGAATAFALGEPLGGALSVVGGVAMAVGVYLHLTEKHAHEHLHEDLEHEHLHTHDDGHHDHVHDPMPVGAHSHAHRHSAMTHSHAHAEDLHHRHAH